MDVFDLNDGPEDLKPFVLFSDSNRLYVVAKKDAGTFLRADGMVRHSVCSIILDKETRTVVKSRFF